MKQVTLIRPETSPSPSRGISSSLPPDLLEQVRGRVRLLALLMMIAFAIDPILYLTGVVIAIIKDSPLPSVFFKDAAAFYRDLPLQIASVSVVIASAGLRWIAHGRRVSATLLHTIGLIYEVVLCFVIALSVNWQYYREVGVLPNLTWVPAVVILFPLILPGPPRRMLGASVVAAAMAPLALFLLDSSGEVVAGLDAYISTIVGCTVAVGFAYMGSRVLYGLGRAVAAARQMGSYSLEEKLGEGGMGEVWRARHRMLARPAAIKLIRPSRDGNGHAGASEEMLRRFQREAEAIAGLRSPHTVELFDFGVADDGSFYYVMELLDGLDADALVRRYGPVPAERAIHLIRQVCHSLSEADSQGLVHRDIKPANVFLCRYGEDHDFVKVLDFGIVKAAHETAGPGPSLTRESTVHGTPAFIAPEQARGEEELDGRADIYATGCVAYWLLTGQLVFSGKNPVALLMHHIETAPVPPSARTELPIPPALDQLVLSCLAKNPADRPQTARDLSRRLSEIEGANAWTEERGREWWGRYQPAAARSLNATAS